MTAVGADGEDSPQPTRNPLASVETTIAISVLLNIDARLNERLATLPDKTAEQ